jgi:hypothetical protein
MSTLDNSDHSGQFHATDEPVDLSVYRWEDWLTFVVFWLLGHYGLLPVLYSLRLVRLSRMDGRNRPLSSDRGDLSGRIDGSPPQHSHSRRIHLSSCSQRKLDAHFPLSLILCELPFWLTQVGFRTPLCRECTTST